MRLIAGLLLLVCWPAYSQDCGLPGTDVVPANAAYLRWDAVTLFDDGGAIPSGAYLYYVVYETTVEAVRICRTTERAAAITNLADGLHTWVVRAMISWPDGNVSSEPSNTWSKDVGAVVQPPPVASRRPSAPVLSGE